MLPRHRQILEYVRQHGDASVDALARVLGVTTQTIRRDIRQLEDERLLARYHGGVGLPSSVENIDYDQRQVLHIDAKRRIAEVVARHIEPGRSLIINIGTTTEEISKALVGQNGLRGLRVITNNLNVASILSGSPDAEVIVAGGLGLGSPENFQLVRQLATVLGAEYGCSRPLVQKGWVTSDRQIGQTGKTIRPKLYIAAGISGAIQHRVGVEGADLIVAINTDRNAPIFDFAHMGIVTDAIRLLPALTAAFRARLSPHSRDRIAS